MRAQYIALDDDTADALRTLARAEDETIRRTAAQLIAEGLRRRGLLEDERRARTAEARVERLTKLLADAVEALP